MSYKDYKWEVVAHDYDSCFLRDHLWVESNFEYPKLLGVPSPFLGVVAENNKLEYVAVMSKWQEAHEALKAKIVERYENFDELIENAIDLGERMNGWSDENIFRKDLTVLPGGELVKLLEKFVDFQKQEYTYGVALPILDFQNFSFIEGNLSRFLKARVPAEDYQKYYSIFTEPLQNSFARDQEESLLRLLAIYWDGVGFKEDVMSSNIDQIQAKYLEFYSKLKAHSEKYGWVYYSYTGPAFAISSFYDFAVDYVRKDIHPAEVLANFQKRRAEILELRQKYLNELRPEGLDKFVLEHAAKVVWAKPRRKDYQSKSYFHVEKLCREIGKRLFLSLEQTRSMPINEIEKALNGGIVDANIANTIRKFHICLPNEDGSVSTLVGEEAKDFSANNISRKIEKNDVENIEKIVGTTAHPGKATGMVKIINSPADMSKMEYTNVLVSRATTPGVVPAMKKAAAIISDEGGLTCHAAIVSRELGIPCVVGTKIATKALTDGDLVEVDADNGIIRIIK